jgi:hypothetical protein
MQIRWSVILTGSVLSTLFRVGAVMGETINFDSYSPGALPPAWTCGVTGSGGSRWTVEPGADAPSPPNIVKQSGVGDFPWCALKSASVADGYVEVKFKALSGRSDQAGGVVWRWKDGNNYYVARANALENNVSLYYTTNGRRNTIKYVDAPVPKNTWQTLRVDFAGKSIKVSLNGKTYIDVQDSRISGAGAVGMWTKADSVTAFDDFAYGAAGAAK